MLYEEKRSNSMLPLLLLKLFLISLFINNAATMEILGSDELGEDPDVQNINVVYEILYGDLKDFNDQVHMEYSQMEIALFFYKKFCFSILTEYKHMEKETEEFREHFHQIEKDYQDFSKRTVMLDHKICNFYKMFVRMIFDKILDKSEHWRHYLHFRTRHLFWLDNQWKINMEEFFKNKKFNWQSKENCKKKECNNLIKYLTKNPQSYMANYWSLKWLLANSSEFIKTVKEKSDKNFLEMKRRIFILTGPIGFDRLELTKMDILKIGSLIPEFVQICLKRYLTGNEDSRRYQLRMSISLLINNFTKFRQSMSSTKKKIEENKQNLAKFDRIYEKINGLLSSIADLEDINILNDEGKLEQVISILIKLYEIFENGNPKIKIEHFAAINEDDLFESNLNLELMERKEIILADDYFKLIDNQLKNADEDMENILQKGNGSIYRLASLIGGSDNLLEIWAKYTEKIRSTEYFNIDFDKRIRKFYEILLNNENLMSQFLSSVNLNIILLMNTIEKILAENKNQSFKPLLEDWRCMMRLKLDLLYVKPAFMIRTDKEMTLTENLILEFTEKWAKKRSYANEIRAEFEKLNEQKDEILKKDNEKPELSSRFQDIHIGQLIKLAEEDKQNYNNNEDPLSEAKTFNFWLFFQELSTNRDLTLLARLAIIFNKDGMEKLMEKVSLLTKIEEKPMSGQKLKKRKNKKKTSTEQSIKQGEELRSDMTAESSSKENESSKEKESSRESLEQTSADVQLHLPNIEQILHTTSSIGHGENLANVVDAGSSDSTKIHIETSIDQTKANSPAEFSPTTDVTIPSSEMYQNNLTKSKLELVLNESKWLTNDIIDAYLEMLINGNLYYNDGTFGFIPSFVILSFKYETKFPMEWLQKTLQQRIADNVQYWLIPAHLNENHWVLTVMDVHENRLHYFDSLNPGSTDEKFTREIFNIFHYLYIQIDHPLSGQFVFSENDKPPTKSRTDLPKQKNGIDCGIFLLMYALNIFIKKSTDAEMHIIQGGIKEARKRIYRELMLDRFKSNYIDDDVLESLYLLHSPEQQISESKNLLQSKLGEAKESSKIIKSTRKIERLPSIHIMPMEEPKDKWTDIVKNVYYEGIFAKDYNESTQMHTKNGVKVALFHFKKLASSILMEFIQNYMGKMDEIFCNEIEARYIEYRELLKLEGKNVAHYACIFFKFFMRLKKNIILTNYMEWNNYARFRMRHFYWIDPKFDESINSITPDLIMEEKDCNEEEIKKVIRKIAIEHPYSNISHWWTLKWLLQNSPKFKNDLNAYKGEELLVMKKRIFDLLGENGFDRLEMAIPVLKFHDGIEEMTLVSIKRGSELDKQKLDNIYEQIVDVKLVQFIDEEHTLEEEMDELKEAICILLKFFEMIGNESFPIVSKEKVLSISYEQAMQCTVDEFESTMERQRFMLQFYYYNTMEDHLCNGDEQLLKILKYEEGAIYRLKELIGYDNLRELWMDYLEKIRDRKYFSKSLDHIRQSFEMFITTKDAQIRQLNKTKIKIYILMRWLDHTLEKYDRSFGGLLSNWHLLFRANLDQLRVHPNQVNTMEIDCTFRGENIIEFVNKWKFKTRDEQRIREEYDLEQEKIDNFIDNFNTNEALPLMDGYQLILVETIQALVNEDKKGKKTKIDTEKAKGVNILQYFKDLHNHPDQIVRIGELLNIDFLKRLYEQLRIKFIASQFSQLGELSMPIIDLEIDEVNSLQKNMPPLGGSPREGGISKSAKRKLRRNKSRLSATSTDEEENISIKESESAEEKIENVQEIPIRKKLERKGSSKEVAAMSPKGSPVSMSPKGSPASMSPKGSSASMSPKGSPASMSPKGKKLERKGSMKEITGTSSPKGLPKVKILERKGSSKEIEKSELDENKNKEKQRQRNLKRFNKEFGETTQIVDLRAKSIEIQRPKDQILRRSLSLGSKSNREFIFSCRWNDYLHGLYDKYLTKPSIRLRTILNACVYINETYAKLTLTETICNYKKVWPNPLPWKIDEQKVKLLREKWRQIIRPYLLRKNNSLENVKKLIDELHSLFYQIQIILNADKERTFNEKSTLEEITDTLSQMHSIKLSHFLSIKSKSKHEKWIKEFMNQSKNKIFGLLQQIDDLAMEIKITKKNYQRFVDRIEAWHKYEAQMALDEKLLKQYKVKMKEYIPRKSHNWQQIMLSNKEKARHSAQTKKLQEKIQFVDRYIDETESGEYERAQIFKKAVNAVEEIIKEWNINAELLHTGSYLIGALTVNSDVDTICMLPKETKLADFFGNSKCEISEHNPQNKSKFIRKRTCTDNSLHCKFCLNQNVMNLSKVETARIPLLKFSYCLDKDINVKVFKNCEEKIEFDLMFAALDKNFKGVYDIDEYIKSLDQMNENSMNGEQLATYTSLTGFKQNIAIIGVLPKNQRNFRITIATIKHWAKVNYIYNPFHGFLKGIGITIMVAKIVIMFPNATVPFLLRMFFFYYYEWPWQMPVQLMEVEKFAMNGQPLWENEERSKRMFWHSHLGISTDLMMPIITPYREDDISFSSSNIMTENTKAIILRSIENALYSLNQIQIGHSAEWDLFLNGMNISKEYQYFLVINCGRMKQILSDDLCSFTNSQLANQVIYNIVNNNKNNTNIYRAHIMHVTGESKNKCIVLRQGGQIYSSYYCKTWLVGIKFIEGNEIKFDKQSFEKILANENERIIQKYIGILRRKENKQKFYEFIKNEQNYFLMSKFVILDEISQWGIDLHGSEIVHQ